MPNITSSQIRAARALLRWRAEDLANKAKLGVATIRRAETREDGHGMTEANEAAVVLAFQNAGIVFIDANSDSYRDGYNVGYDDGKKGADYDPSSRTGDLRGEGVGVRLREAPRPNNIPILPGLE
jgi:hypothetical protein